MDGRIRRHFLGTLTALALAGAASPALGQAIYFARGDANVDFSVDLSDSIFILNYLFLEGVQPTCDDAMDPNDDGGVDVSDPISLLSFLFFGDALLPAPGLGCGYDPTVDGLGCSSYRHCRQPVRPFEVMDGYAVVEGDIIIGRPEEIPFQIGLQDPGQAGGGGFGSTGDAPAYRWPDGIVPFVIDGNIPQPDRITGAIAHWQERTSIRFVPRSTETDFVRFMLSKDGCSSPVGRRGGQQVILVPEWCERMSIVHELGHSLGLFHEQSRLDRDSFIKVLYDNITADKAFNFNKTNGTYYCSPYDFGSIMHYNELGFSKNGKVTIETIPPGIPIGQRGGLSAQDAEMIEFMYGNTTFWSGWTILGAGADPSAAPAVLQNLGGRPQVIALGTDGGMWTSKEMGPSGVWTGWENLGGAMMGAPTIVSAADGRLEAFMRTAPSGGVWHQFQIAPDGAWSGWFYTQGILATDLSSARSGAGTIEIFGLGFDNQLYHRWQVSANGDWDGWESLGGSLTGVPSVVKNGNGGLEVIARGTDGAAWDRWQNNANGDWQGWESLGGYLTSDIVSLAVGSGAIHIFARGADGGVFHQFQDNPMGNWSGWQPLGGQIAEGRRPSALLDVFGTIHVFIPSPDGGVLHSRQKGGGWTAWLRHPKVASVTSNIAVTLNLSGAIEIFARTQNGNVYHSWEIPCP